VVVTERMQGASPVLYREILAQSFAVVARGSRRSGRAGRRGRTYAYPMFCEFLWLPAAVHLTSDGRKNNETADWVARKFPYDVLGKTHSTSRIINEEFGFLWEQGRVRQSVEAAGTIEWE